MATAIEDLASYEMRSVIAFLLNYKSIGIRRKILGMEQ